MTLSSYSCLCNEHYYIIIIIQYEHILEGL